MRYYLNGLYDYYQIPAFIVENSYRAVDELVELEDGSKTVIYYLNDQLIQVAEETLWIYLYNHHDDGTGTLERYKKKSFDWYQKIIATKG